MGSLARWTLLREDLWRKGDLLAKEEAWIHRACLALRSRVVLWQGKSGKHSALVGLQRQLHPLCSNVPREPLSGRVGRATPVAAAGRSADEGADGSASGQPRCGSLCAEAALPGDPQRARGARSESRRKCQLSCAGIDAVVTGGLRHRPAAQGSLRRADSSGSSFPEPNAAQGTGCRAITNICRCGCICGGWRGSARRGAPAAGARFGLDSSRASSWGSCRGGGG
mmetsp:Transcript_32301/g.77180  ORF Transcript_32301/g.77180 Transcript_32301/m.77180 type:complete len:225 (-) Transcript_32301:2272-2946(-)